MARTDCYSKSPSAEVFEKAVAIKLLHYYVKIHVVPQNCTLRSGPLSFWKTKTFILYLKKAEIYEAPVNDHKAIGLLEQMIKRINRRLLSVKLDKDKDFNVR